MSKLAILGGTPLIDKPLLPYSSLDESDVKAVADVMKSGRISEFIGAWCDEFYGGPLIKEFEKITGIPILLNTSFNENEPIVCKPLEALDCFLRTKMDLLVINNLVIKRT